MEEGKPDAKAVKGSGGGGTPDGPVSAKKRGLLAKLTGTVKKKHKRSATENDAAARSNKKQVVTNSRGEIEGRPSVERKSLGDMSNISELTMPNVKGGKPKKLVPRPRGRAPRGKVWNNIVGAWENKVAA